MTYADVSVPVASVVDVYDPTKDYDKADITSVVGSTVDSSVAKGPAISPAGSWALDVESQAPKEVLVSGEMTISKGADEKAFRAVGKARAPIMCFKKEVCWDELLEPTSHNVYMWKSKDASGTVAMTSPTSMTLTSASRYGTFQMVYNKVADAEVVKA